MPSKFSPSLLLSALLLSTLQQHVESFAMPTTQPPQISSSSSSRMSVLLHMAPQFDPTAQKWVPSSEEESAEANYPPIKSLLRHGPKAYLTRVFNADNYDQAVLKFMAMDSCERWEAQGNMDRCNENSQDWTFERLEARRKGIRLDYVTLTPKRVALSVTWVGIVFWFSNECFSKFMASV
jgi:hypothetical protein